MTASEILSELTSRGVRLWAEDGRLRARAPEGVLTPELRDRLAQQKEALLALLLDRDQPEERPIPVDAERRYESFPLTEIQQAYLAGRESTWALGQVACHAYYEFDGPALGVDRLAAAWRRLIARHDMLRTIVLPDGQQQVLRDAPDYLLTVGDLREAAPEDVTARLGELRAELSAQVLQPDRWPLFDIRATLLPGGRSRVHVSFDLLVMDAAGMFAIFEEWRRLYRNPDLDLPALDLTFRDYVLAELEDRGSESWARAERYWQERLPTMPPPPELPFARSPAELGRPRFVRRLARLGAERWTRLKSRAAEAGLTPSGLICAAYGEALAGWSKNRRFTMTLPIFNRFLSHPQLGEVLGDFTSTVLLEVDAREGSFESRAVRLQERLGHDLEHSRVSGVRVLRDLQRIHGEGSWSTFAVFTSLLGHRAFRDGGETPMEWLGEQVWGISQTPQVMIDHHVYEDEGSLLFNWDAVEELFPAGLLDDMFAAYQGLLERLADSEEAWREAPKLTPAAHAEIYAEANATAAPVPPMQDGLLHTLFERMALAQPERPAVVSAELTLSYGQLRARVSALAHELRGLGARPNRLVAVVMEKGWEQAVATLGIMASGGAYLPVSPDLPAERLRYLLENGEVEIAVTQPRLAASLDWPENVQRVVVEAQWDGSDLPMPAITEPVQSPEDIAYVIYTSGSTGRPKGVVIDHRGAVNTIVDINQRFGVGPEDRVLAVSSLSFDLSVYDLFGVLAAGGTVVIPEPWANRDPARWAEWMVRERVTLWNTVPTLMEMLVEYLSGRGESLAPALRLVMMSGDWIPLTLPERIHAQRPEARVVSLGGATEASIWSILYPIDRVELGWRSVPYGRAMVNQSFHVLDESLEPRPLWVPGNLYIGGTGLAKGYWRDEDKTSASFVLHPRTGERLYRTGDLGRWLPEGNTGNSANIEFLGREDLQVKVQGHRIELGEIEAALLQHEGVRAAVVTVAGDPRGSRRLVAYVVPALPPGPEARELQQFLRDRLPESMMPAEILTLESLPLTANGKVDRQALPAPGERTAARPEFTSPRTSLERRLAAIWSDVLGVPQVSIHDEFLQLGGNSLAAIRLYTQIRRELQVELPLRLLLRAGSVARLAEAIVERLGEAQAADEPLPPLVPAPAGRFEPFPMTDIQQAYWVGRTGAFELGNVAPHAYLELESAGLDPARFQAAWQRLIDRHDMLRAVVLPDGRQQVLEQVPPYEVEVLDLTRADAGTAERELAAVRERMSHQVLAADRWPLFEIRASALPGGRVRLHISLDLLIGDAWSMVRLVQELTDLYEDPSTELPPLEITFRDYVLVWEALQSSPQHRRSLEYWMRRLQDLAPAPELPLVRDPASLGQPRFVRRSTTLDPETWRRLQEHAARAGLTPSSLLCSAFAEVLAAWSKSPRFSLNTTLFNRLPLHPQVDQVVGDFTSMVLLEFDGSGPGGFQERAKRLQEQLWEDLEHRFVSGVRVLRELARRGGGPRAAMPVVFTSTLIEGGTGDRAGMQWFRLGEPVYSVSQTPQVWLDHQVFEEKGALLLNWDAVEELFPAGLLDDMFAAYRGLLERLADSEAAWREAPKLTPAAHAEIYAEANATAAPVPPMQDGLLHTLFERMALAQPERPAVVSAELTLSYGQLRARVSALAHELRGLGARPNRLVAVVMEKGWEQAVATLGIMASGGAYLPISPDLPAERLRYLLENGEVEIAVTQPRLAASLDWPENVQRVVVEAQWDGSDLPMPAIAEPVQSPEDIAYVIYTSGSTGRPKGVVIDHRGAVNTIVDINQRFGVGPEDRVLAVSSLSFDLSVYDLFGVLAAGGTVVIPEPWANRDPARWAEWMVRERVTLWNTVPTLMEMLVEYLSGRGESLAPALRLVMMSGDWIPLTLPERIHAQRPEARVVSLGGATEASIWSILYPVERVEPGWRSVPYGRAMVNQTFQVLDESLEPRPLWVPGNLYIGGIGLAKGYWHDEEKTGASFVLHPRTGERLYRTGDLGRWLPDGNIEFLGREDFQVKVQGHRIELGEIEAAMLQHESVRAAVVTVAGDPRGSRRLVAYVVGDSTKLEAAPAPAAPAGETFHAGGGEVTDPLERLEFKLARHGVRKLALDGAMRLGRPAPDEAAYLERRSHREFLSTALPVERLSRLLGCLFSLEIEGLQRYRYASAGGLYPVQAYVYAAPGRVAGLPGGTYYYHPLEHALAPISDAAIDPAVHAPVNRAAFEGSAFSIFLVGDLAAIAPLYGDLARDFCLLEAGYISQLLMQAAGRMGSIGDMGDMGDMEIGLCPIGGLDFGPVRGLLGLGDSHLPLHTLVGGPIDPALVRSLAPQRPAALQSPPVLRSPDWLAALRAFLAIKLPDHMIPSAIVPLDELPLTANGKVDRRQLPAPDALLAQSIQAEHVAPRNEIERSLAEILQEFLGVERVGVLENFFTLGANSMHMIQLHNRLRTLVGRDLPIVDMFRCSNISDLAAYLSRDEPDRPAFEQATGRAEERREGRARRRGARRVLRGDGDV